MGNQATRASNVSAKKADAVTHTGDSANSANNLSKSSSGSELESNTHMQFLPIENLAKILSHRTHDEERINGITASVFQRYLFPNYPELGEKLFNHLHHAANVSTSYLSANCFKQQAEKFLSVMNDQAVLENYVKMYSDIKGDGNINPDGLKALLNISYNIFMNNSGLSSCIYKGQIIDSAVSSCFHGKNALSVSYVSNWIWQNCARVIYGPHRYIIHVLTTAYRNGNALLSKEQPQPHLLIPTPILEQPDSPCFPQVLLPMSYVWLLSSTLPECYLQADNSPKDITHALIAKRMGNLCPRHWTLLYNSSEHGTGANRFLHHVLGYRGPTLLFIRTVSPNEDTSRPIYCICSAIEWRESHLYWGDEDTLGIELFPSYRIIEKGAKVLYLNTNIRGYPHGLRFGSNPRSPYINIDESFHSVSIAGAPYPISSLEVWGCGDTKLRERQLEIKKWQVKEAEKQRIVKLSASDWQDHPDRYLLELAGRTSYNESNK
ncbi:Restriction of telomere capping protein 5 [Melipona quadrifasciata]|uniref:Restriction of telomere capping protein 5 n=1 Tax=Melipona quadrifasciata TaxID=166423 RepID=A0A0M9A7R8_9HYME|nr:Restriction of telomere capping protein 5 [Melipona quadrifasciata]